MPNIVGTPHHMDEDALPNSHVHSARIADGSCTTCDSLKEMDEARNRPYENEFEQWIRENIMKDCWHNLTFDDEQKSDVCTKCGIPVHYMWGGSRQTVNKYNYSTSLDAVAKVEEKVIASKGQIHLRRCLYKVIYKDLSTGNGRPTDELVLKEMTFANASQRARACKLAWETDKDAS